MRWLETEVEKVYYDALTGIYNRRFFNENLNRVIKSLSRSGAMLSVLMIDLDCFKKYNDTYGHGDGDSCLKAVAEALSRCVTRTDDFIARYGGEEFCTVLPNTDEAGARLIAENMLKSVRALNLPHIASEVADYVTVSIGGTTGKVNFAQISDDYIKRADEMLYVSKQNGRDRYNFAPL